MENNHLAPVPLPGRDTTRTATDRRHSPSRERVLRHLEMHGPSSVLELAAATQLHENTVRGHLTRLRDDGFVQCESAPSLGRGRPTQRWRAVSPHALNPYAGLAATLAKALIESSSNAADAARAAGEKWGAELAGNPTSKTNAHRNLLEIMREQGFAPDEQGEQIHLRRCPLLATASKYSEVVCASHRGMIEGIVREQAPQAQVTLLPFAEGGDCVLRIRGLKGSTS